MTERFVRDVLLKRKWSKNDLDELTIVYISRGSPGSRSKLHGFDIEHIGRSFLDMGKGTMIPFHRIVEIYKGDALIWKRDPNHRP